MTDKTIEQRARELLAEAIDRPPQFLDAMGDGFCFTKAESLRAIARALQQQVGGEGVRGLLREAVPYLRDAGEPFEDDGGNEPLELARRIEDALESDAALAAMGGQGEVERDDREVIKDRAFACLVDAAEDMLAEIDTCGHAVDPGYRTALHGALSIAKSVGHVPHWVPEGMALAYGYLWHAGNPSEVPGDNLVLPPEIAAAKARLELRNLLTTDQRCWAIDKVRAMLAAAQQQEKK